MVVYSVEKTVVKIDYDVLDLLLRLEKEYNVRFLLEKYYSDISLNNCNIILRDYNIISKLGVVKKDTLVKFTSDKLIFERGCLNSEDM